LFQLRLVQCELEGFGMLGPSRVVAFAPAFSLIVGDTGSGKTTLVGALIDAFCGPSGTATGQSTRLSVSTPTGEQLEVRVDWARPHVQLIGEDGDTLFESGAWNGLLEFLERRTGLAGLAASCLLSADDFGWSLPAAVAALVAPGGEDTAEAAQHRDLEEARRDLTDKKTQVETLQRQMRELKIRNESQINRFKSVPEGFPQWLGTLVQARQEMHRLTAAQAAHRAEMQRAREELEQTRASFEEKWGAYRQAGPELPDRLKEHARLEAEIAARHHRLAELEARKSSIRDSMAACQMPLDELPADLDLRVASLPADCPDGIPDVGVERAWQEAIDSLSAARFDTAGDDFPRRLDELAEARREVLRVEAAQEQVQLRLHTIGFEGARHQEAVHWPNDFPDRLGQLRRQQQADAERLQALQAEAAQHHALHQELTAARQALAAFEGLHEAPADLAERVEALVVGRRQVSESVASVEAQKRRLADIETMLAAQYDRFKDVGDDYPARLERQAAEASREEGERLKADRDRIQRCIEQDYGDVRNLPADFSKKLKEYDKLVRLQQSLDSRREATRHQLAEKQAQLDEELPLFSGLPSETLDMLAERGQRDAVLLRLLVHLDNEIADRLRLESALARLEASMEGLPNLPDGVPLWHKLVEEQRQMVADLEKSALTEETRDAVLSYLVRSRQKTEVEAELERARTHLAALDDEFHRAGLPLDDPDLNAWLSHQEVTVALASEAEKKSGLQALFGAGTEEGKDKLAAAHKERTRLLAGFKLTSPDEVPKLFARDREAREKLASARARVDAAENALEEFEDLAPPRDLGLEGPEDVFRVLTERTAALDPARKLLQQAEASLGMPPELPPDVNLVEASERQTKLREEKTGLVARLEQLRPVPELEATRAALLVYAGEALHDLPEDLAGDDGVRRVLRYQALHREVAELRASMDQSSPGSKVSKLNEQLAQQRAQLEGELGAAATADPAETASRWQQLQDLHRELADANERLQAHPGDRGASLDRQSEALHETLRRLHVDDEAELASGEALKRYHTYRALGVEVGELKTEIEGSTQRHLDRLAELESAVAPWGTGVAEVEPLVVRWRAASQAAAEVTALEARLASMPESPQETLAALQADMVERCRALAVPVSAERDLALLARWSEYTTWRHQFAALAEEQERLLAPGPAVLASRLASLEADLGVAPGEDLEEARQDFLAAREARARAEAMSARWMMAADVELEGAETLSSAGLPILGGSACASLTRYQGYGRWLRTLREVETEVEGVTGLPELETQMQALRTELGGHAGEDPVEAEAALAAYAAATTRVADLEMALATLDATDVQAREALEAAAKQATEAESRLGDWSRTDDVAQLLEEYRQYSTARTEAYRLHHELSRLPSVQELSGRLEAVEQALLSLPPDAAQQALHEFFERCQYRASELVTRVTMGRARLQFDEDQVRVVPNSDVETAMSPRPGDLWWKLAVCLELGAQHPWPIVLDEPFAGLSTVDKMELSELLMEISAERQVVVLTAERGLAMDVGHDLNVGSPAATH
jgi:energy-coupling factor transporter ATP-binding protein EcfA2